MLIYLNTMKDLTIKLINLILKSNINEDKYNQILKVISQSSEVKKKKVEEMAKKYDSELIYKYPMLYLYTQQTPDFSKRLVSQTPETIRYIKEENINYDIAKMAVSRNGILLKYIPKKIANRDILELIAIKQNPGAIRYSQQTHKNNILAVSISGFTIEYIKEQTPEIALMAVKQNGGALQFVDKSLQTPELIAAALESNTEALQYVEPKFQTPELCGKYIKKYPNLIRYIENKNITPDMILSIVSE